MAREEHRNEDGTQTVGQGVCSLFWTVIGEQYGHIIFPPGI